MDEPKLGPVAQFHEADEVETQLKALTMEVFQDFIRDNEREMNTFGMPHLGSFAHIERWVKADGLAMVRGNSEDAMRYLFNAWRSRNPKRGLHFLRTYLQLLWPGGWVVNQLWQRKSAPYPTALYALEEMPPGTTPSDDHFLTSRINVDIVSTEESGVGLASVANSIRSACGAKFVVTLRNMRQSTSTMTVVSLGTPNQFLGSTGSSTL